MTEEASELIDFQSSTREVRRKTFEAAIAQKSPPVHYKIVPQAERKAVKLQESKGAGTMVLQRVD